MNNKRIKILLALTTAVLLIAATLLTSPLPQTASAFEKVQGQDKTGKNCERQDTAGSSTFGKCESVCKGKDVVRDALNNRWVCKAYAVGGAQTGATHTPLNGQVLDSSTPKPKPPKAAAPKADKAKKQ